MTERSDPRPRIGVTAPKNRWHFTYVALLIAVRVCGGRPRALHASTPIEETDVDGVVLGGGTDVFPGLYQADPKQRYLYDHDRDRMELAWLERVERERLPVLGVCRGAQMMNVAHGGTLHLDVNLAYDDLARTRNAFRKALGRLPVSIADGSLLHRLTGTRELAVNALHTQSVDRLAEGFRVTGREPNGIVQALERDGYPFYLGVQFHPELMIYRPSMRSLFRGLMDAARNRARGVEALATA